MPLPPLILVGIAAAITIALLTGQIKKRLRFRANRAVLSSVKRFRLRLERHRLVRRDIIRSQLLGDPVVRDAIATHCKAHSLAESEVELEVRRYIDEIVPFFNVLSYYRVGYNLARMMLGLLYRVTSEYQDRNTLDSIPHDDVVVYLINHRSNVDYVVLAYVLAHGVSISYAVGEWARVWPLEYIFKSFGSYFVRRRYRVPLYHSILERYVQLITRNGVTQGIFLEGGLSRDGKIKPAKIGLLDYIAGTLSDAQFGRNIWLVPVAINYDRVLEDRTLIHELLDDAARPGPLRRLGSVVRYLLLNFGRLILGRLRRYGRVAVNFGTPLSLQECVGKRADILNSSKERRLPALQSLADEVLGQIGQIMPVTPVPLVAAALLSFDETLVQHSDLLDRVTSYRNHLHAIDAKVTHADLPVEAVIERAWKMLTMRRLVARMGEAYVMCPGQLPLLEYYANSITHLLPKAEPPNTMHPAQDGDQTLPRLRHSN